MASTTLSNYIAVFLERGVLVGLSCCDETPSPQSIGCDDFLGSDKVVDKCGVCGGDNTGCQVVSGVFKHALTSLGYHRVVEIPQGATKINITEMHKSNNYLDSIFQSCQLHSRILLPGYRIDQDPIYQWASAAATPLHGEEATMGNERMAYSHTTLNISDFWKLSRVEPGCCAASRDNYIAGDGKHSATNQEGI
ncbi:thrombospondin type-1 domain-containing protein 4 [Cricetulus griseus]|uniref:Thrombospondin type-1 domain-containing protein 4 n=1 Tax=Cricetulus griseus TaxID=10029 RepID=A0A061I5V7_CRIGR|nr:thrombospondin type-1 domain-containing protein 4 [Cricetulus griseus]